MRVIIFGTGVWYQRYKKIIFEQSEVVGIIDNNSSLWNKKIDDMSINSPYTALNMQFDSIILLSAKATEMYMQLVKMGIQKSKIMYWEQYRAHMYTGQMAFWGKEIYSTKKKIGIVTINLNYDGGTISAIYAAIILQKKGYSVTLCTPEADPSLLSELVEQGLYIAICPEIPYMGIKFNEWISKFDLVIVNTLPLIRCASEIGRICPTIWWIHESGEMYSSVYETVKNQYSEYWNSIEIDNCRIVGVSRIAKEKFNYHFPNMMNEILTFGIPDTGICQNSEPKMIFAIIGTITPLKAQDIFIKAVSLINSSKRDKCEFWLIGRESDYGYVAKIKSMARDIQQIQFKGQYSRKKMEEAYKEISVVVCSSLEETMSITVVEGMMHGKIVITTDNTGIADYITDSVNGYVCQAGNVNELSQTLEYLIDHRNELDAIRCRARKTYEKHFSMDGFGENLEQLINSDGRNEL